MTQARPDAQLASGGMVADRYRIGDPIGRGGTAAVYEALDLQTGRIVAVKVMAQPPGPQKLTREHYLLMEAQLSMRLTSPHAVRLFEVGVLPDGRPFLVMERLFGRDVGRQLLERGPMSVMDACDIVLQACHALAEAHRLGVVHRDVKPPNLFLTVRADGTPHVKVLDFGLAMMVVSELEGPEMTPTTRNFRVAGTPGYAAPEQIGSRRAIDERADVWALGVVLHELVLGRRPFEGATLIGTLVAAGRDPLPPLGPVPPEFEAIVRRCLEKDRERRFANVADLADALAPLAPPVLADYPELVRIAGGRAMPVEESTQRVLPEDDGPTSVIPSRVNSGIDGPLSGPVSSRRRGDATQNDLVRVDPTRSNLHRVEASSSFVAQVVPPRPPPGLRLWRSSPWPRSRCSSCSPAPTSRLPRRTAPRQGRRRPPPRCCSRRCGSRGEARGPTDGRPSRQRAGKRSRSGPPAGPTRRARPARRYPAGTFRLAHPPFARATTARISMAAAACEMRPAMRSSSTSFARDWRRIEST